MRIGLLSDAHGNSMGLSACLKKLAELKVERIYFLGDAVGYLPGEAEVLKLLREENVFCQKGNHEAMVLGELSFTASKDRIYGIEGARKRLSDADREYISGWPDHRLLEMNNKKLLLVHASPRDYLQDYIYPDNDLKLFDGLSFDAVFMGHTHRPFIAHKPDGMKIVNVGSCGIPRDEGDLLAFAIYDVTEDDCEIFRMRFDTSKVKQHFGQQQVAEEVYAVFARRAETSPFGRLISGDSL